MQKRSTLTEPILTKILFLYLERTRMTKVWVDDQLVGDFDSLNTPHEYDLTPYLKQTHFRLTILVSNVDYPTKGGHLTSPDTQTNWNGIIGEIALHIFDQCYIKNVKTFPDTKTRTVRVTFDTVNTTKEEHELTLQTQAFFNGYHVVTPVYLLPQQHKKLHFRLEHTLTRSLMLWVRMLLFGVNIRRLYTASK